MPLDTSFESILAKYRRRVTRLLGLIRRARNVLVLRLDRPDLGDKFLTPVEDCVYARETLCRRFAPTDFTVVLLQRKAGVSFADRTVELVADGVIRIAFDYRNPQETDTPFQPLFELTSAAIADIASVRDYRTRAEQKADAQRIRLKRWAKYGASGFWQYTLRRIRASLHGAAAGS